MPENIELQVGDIVSTFDGEVALADEHVVYDIMAHKYITVGKATIKLQHGWNSGWYITGLGNALRGLTCLLHEDFSRCLIISVKIIKVYPKHVLAMPIDFLRCDTSFDLYCHGLKAEDIINQRQYPNIRRIKMKEAKVA
jgi:hypothetical protein